MHRSKAGRKILFRDCSRSFRIRPPSSAGNCYNGFMKRNFRSLFLIAILAAALCFFLGFSLGKNSPTADPVPTPVETPSQPQPTADEKIDEDGDRHITIEIHFNLQPIQQVQNITSMG